MSIEVICPSCQKVHQVKDDAAGKKLRCKGCQAIVPIPALVEALDEADPWENLGEDDGGDELPPIVRKAAPAKKTVKRERARSGDGMPLTVIASICINALFALFSAFTVVVTLIAGVISVQTAVGLIRLACDVTIVIGLIKRNNRIRWNSIALDGFGLGLIFLCIAPVMLLARRQLEENLDPNMPVGLVMFVLAGMGALWIADLVLLLTPSAKDFCNE